MGRGQKEEAIIGSIMPLAQNLGMDVVAEGVETQEQLDFLKQMECKYAQGFYFSRPIPAEDAQELLLNPAIRAGVFPKVSIDGAGIKSVELINVSR